MPIRAESLHIEILDQETVAPHLSQLLMPDGMRPHLQGQMERRGLRVAALFIGDRLVANGIWNPDSPTREDTLRHIPHGTPSISMVETREGYRGNGFATLVLEAICNRLREEGYSHTYLVANPADTYERPGEGAQSLDAFYTGRGFENWGRGPIPLIHHPADETQAAEGDTVNVYVKSLIPDVAATAILLTPPAGT
ncbi:MAG TPA: GNAT family N-acetyltransferase [Candidatus Pristimantibacillus sp.]|nr:GNAT family N-acetyltransferase [Candidatus Pristimantibacillus sp.]